MNNNRRRNFRSRQQKSNFRRRNGASSSNSVNNFNINAVQNREDSQFLVFGGFGSIIIGSSMSAFFALERNTRKKED